MRVLSTIMCGLLILLAETLGFSLNAQQSGEADGEGESHVCIHDEIMATFAHEQRIVHQLYDATRKRIAGQKLRIHMDVSMLQDNADVDNGQLLTCYSNTTTIVAGGGAYKCLDKDRLTDEKKSWLVDILLVDALTRLQEALYVDPVVGGVQLAGSSCQNVPFGSGMFPDADVVVFVTTRPVLTYGSTMVYAGACQFDQKGRAIAGAINVDLAKVLVDEEYSYQVGVILHELTHILGYSGGRFGSFVGLTKNDVVRDVPNVAGKTVQVIATPRVLSFVREHFDCASLLGAEIEDGGAEGLAGSHWEKRVFMDDYMTGSYDNLRYVAGNVFSPLTLAYFEDSGWYTSANYSVTDPLIWGRGLGCDFATKMCGPTEAAPNDHGWPTKDEYPGYFCLEDTDVQCSFDLRAKAECKIFTRSPAPPPVYRYTGLLSFEGGASALADYCPLYVSVEYCTEELTSDGARCNDCRCFETENATLACHEMRCFDASTVKVKVGKYYYTCPDDADAMGYLLGTEDKVKCPAANVIVAVCANVTYDTNYPSITDVHPSKGAPGTVITVNGALFQQGCTVEVGVPAESVTFKSASELSVKLAGDSAYDDHLNPLYTGGPVKDVVVINPDGRTALFEHSFTVDFGSSTPSEAAHMCAGSLFLLFIVFALCVLV